MSVLHTGVANRKLVYSGPDEETRNGENQKNPYQIE